MKRFTVLFPILCCFTMVFAQTEVVNSRSVVNFPNGIAYNLPKTVLVVTVNAVKMTRQAGPYFRYSERYLATKDVITENSESWAIASVAVCPKAVPDPANRYVVRPENNSTAFYLALTSDGILEGANVPFVPVFEKKNEKKSIQAEQSTTALSVNSIVVSEEVLQANSVAKMAELAAKQIYRLRDSRMNLITGDLDKMPDGKALEQMLKNIDKSEKELTALFVGKVTTNPIQLTFEVTPEQDIKNEVLFRLSSLTGVVRRDDLSGQPYYINVKDVSDKLQPVAGKESQNGLFYRLPGKAVVTIADPSGNVLFNKDFTIAQFGTIQSLPASLFNKSTVKARFDVQTGALISIEK
jgi:hypothetical protein